MLGLKLIRISKRGPEYLFRTNEHLDAKLILALLANFGFIPTLPSQSQQMHHGIFVKGRIGLWFGFTHL